MPDAAPKHAKPLHCPSAPATSPDAQIFGVVVRSEGEDRVAYLEEPIPLDAAAAELAEGLDPTEIFRVTSRCFEGACKHYQDHHCTLGDEVHATRAPVAEALPPCSIRAHCRWFAEQGASICLRCPQVVTHAPSATAAPGDKAYRRLKVV